MSFISFRLKGSAQLGKRRGVRIQASINKYNNYRLLLGFHQLLGVYTYVFFYKYIHVLKWNPVTMSKIRSKKKRI
jgi:hypothetical protein